MTVSVRTVIVSATTTTFPWFKMGTTSPYWTFTKSRAAGGAGGGGCVVRMDISLNAPGDVQVPLVAATFIDSQVTQTTAAVMAATEARFAIVSVSGASSSYVFNFLQAGE